MPALLHAAFAGKASRRPIDIPPTPIYVPVVFHLEKSCGKPLYISKG
jgi:hypothetical protein